MNLKIDKPYQQIWSTLLIITIFSILGFNRTFDIQQHDTYFVFLLRDLGIVLFILLSFIGGIYWLFKKKELIGWITKSHVGITIILSIVLIFLGFFFRQLISLDHFFLVFFAKVFLVSSFLLGMAQILLAINLIIAY